MYRHQDTSRHSRRTRRVLFPLLTASLLLVLTGSSCPSPFVTCATCPPPDPKPLPPDGLIARVVITPGAALLTGPGEMVGLAAQLTAVDGGTLPSYKIDWSSSDPSVATVDANGIVTAVAGLGSAQITATCGGIASMPIIALIAQPALGAALVADDNVMEPPAPVDPNAEYGVGYRYTVKLTGMLAPAIGQILVGTGEQPIGGRVVDVKQDGGASIVTLQTVAANELFSKLQVKMHADLDRAPVELQPNIAGAYDTVTDPDGTIHFMPKPPPAKMALRDAAARTKINIGPFECTDLEDVVAFPVTFSQPPIFSVSLKSTIDFDYDTEKGGFQKLILVGEPKISMGFSPLLAAAASASLSCKAELLTVRAPIGGPLSLLISPLLVVEAGFEVNGGLTFAQVGFESSLELTAKTQIGVDCSGVDGCKMVNTFDPAATPSYKPILPDLSHVTDQFALNVGLGLFGAAKFKIGNPFLSSLSIEFVKVKAGPAFDMTLYTAQAQAADASKASSFKLDLKATAGLGDEGSINEYLDKLFTIRFVEAKIERVLPLAASPKGAFTITPDQVKPGTANALGDVALFNATMDKSTFLGIEAIDGVEFYWMKNGRLEPGRPQCSSVSALPGQTVFTCTTDFLDTQLGEQTFYAFYKAKLFGIPLPFPIEIGDDAKAELTVPGRFSIDYIYHYASGAMPNSDLCGPLISGEVGCFAESTQLGTTSTACSEAQVGGCSFSVQATSTLAFESSTRFVAVATGTATNYPSETETYQSFVVTANEPFSYQVNIAPTQFASVSIDEDLGAGVHTFRQYSISRPNSTQPPVIESDLPLTGNMLPGRSYRFKIRFVRGGADDATTVGVFLTLP